MSSAADDTQDSTAKHKTHRDPNAGRKAEKKKAKKKHVQELTDKQRNPKAFTFNSAVKAEKRFRRKQDIETKKQHISYYQPLVDRTPLEPPPILVAVVGPPKVGKSLVIQCLIKNYVKQPLISILGLVTIVSGKKRRITFMECNNDINSMIDIAKVADLVLLLVDASFGFEMEIFEFLNICQVHGMPRVMGVLTHLDLIKNSKQMRKTKKTLKHRFWTEVYAGAKLFYLSGLLHDEYLRMEIKNLARFISVMKFRLLTWRTTHPYILADRIEDLISSELIRQNPKIDRTISLYGSLPLPEQIKKRALVEKERLIYAPFSGVGGIVYDKDAVYVELGGSHSYKQKDTGIAGVLINTQETLDQKLQRSELQLFSDAAPIKSQDVNEIMASYIGKLVTENGRNKKKKMSATKVENDMNLDEIELMKDKRKQVLQENTGVYHSLSKESDVLIKNKVSEALSFLEAAKKNAKQNGDDESFDEFSDGDSRARLEMDDSDQVSDFEEEELKTNKKMKMKKRKKKKKKKKRITCAQYTPEHVACMSHLWSPITPQGTGILAVQDVASREPGFRIAATGSVVEMDKSTQVVKKLKLTGVPMKIYRKTAFIKDMFNSALEVAKFEGARIKTVSGIRGQIKKAAAKPEGCFRATFEDKILLSDIVFCRTSYKIDVPRFYNLVTSLLLPPAEKNQWRGMKTTGQLKRERNIRVEANRDSMYTAIHREPKVFKPLYIPRKLQKELPYRDKPKQAPPPNRNPKFGKGRVAVVREPEERKVARLMRMIRTSYARKQQQTKQAMTKRITEYQARVAAEGTKRLKKQREMKKEVFRNLSKLEKKTKRVKK
ncbi:Ribosome biogenesis protein BMS1-like protein [Harpegnathos saltator]|uniref:Ribosome biogenesis protein BMS1-like protein n=1 Tax=Harpegnathos saltator TaxID=610380 RepID=E2BGB6_HARSA|nr:Ribosome biogenesis protein BMS1-like protein [Harpegnathos saltator]